LMIVFLSFFLLRCVRVSYHATKVIRDVKKIQDLLVSVKTIAKLSSVDFAWRCLGFVSLVTCTCCRQGRDTKRGRKEGRKDGRKEGRNLASLRRRSPLPPPPPTPRALAATAATPAPVPTQPTDNHTCAQSIPLASLQAL
jgi:hypothetical protein